MSRVVNFFFDSLIKLFLVFNFFYLFTVGKFVLKTEMRGNSCRICLNSDESILMELFCPWDGDSRAVKLNYCAGIEVKGVFRLKIWVFQEILDFRFAGGINCRRRSAMNACKRWRLLAKSKKNASRPTSCCASK